MVKGAILLKIRFWNRLILFLGAVLSILSGALLFVSGLQIQGLFAETAPGWFRPLCLVMGLLLVLFGSYLIVFPRRFAAGRKDFVVQRTDNGELRIAVKAIENLVQKCIDLHDEIRLVSMKILNSRDGVIVDLCVALANNISIPLAVASLQKQIKQYLAASSGIEVKEVRVSVESAQEEMDLAREEESEDEAEKAAQDGKKPPLHQRLFGKLDQPAMMPQAPEAEQEPAAGPDENEEEAQASQEEETAPEENAPSFPEEQSMPAQEEPSPAGEKEDERHE